MRRAWLGAALLALAIPVVVTTVVAGPERSRRARAGADASPASTLMQEPPAGPPSAAGSADGRGAPAGAIHAPALEPARAARDDGDDGDGGAGLARVLAAYSREELALFARFERVTGRAAPPELLELVERRRAGAGRGELVDAASRLFPGDPLARAAALGWARAAGAADGGRARRE